MSYLWYSVLTVTVLVGCTHTSDRVTLRVWHFWSEPRQEQVFKEIVARFEKNHPDVHIELVPLQWTDGKAKLQIAFASNQPPDIVHIGSEWVRQFAPALAVLDTTISASLAPQFAAIGCVGNNRYAVPWTVNARVLYVHRALQLTQPVEWVTFSARLRAFHNPPERYGLGFCVSDPHNVLKRVLPFLWACGSNVLLTEPFSASVGSATVVAFDSLTQLARYAIVEPARQLDERLRRGQLGAVISGVWMLADSAVLAQYEVLPRIPTSTASASGATILSSDCYAITRQCRFRSQAEDFLRYLVRWETAQSFCTKVPDAGFPACKPPSADHLEVIVQRSLQWRAAYQQVMNACVLPSPPYFLDAERRVEELLTAVLYGKLSSEQAVDQLQMQLKQLER